MMDVEEIQTLMDRTFLYTFQINTVSTLAKHIVPIMLSKHFVRVTDYKLCNGQNFFGDDCDKEPEPRTSIICFRTIHKKGDNIYLSDCF